MYFAQDAVPTESSAAPDSPARHVSVRQLRYFVTVAEYRSFRRAAESLCISQPPITKQIQALEDTLGVALLNRSRRRFALTEAGEAFYTEARMLLRGLERVCDTMRAFHGTGVPALSIGMADDFIYGPHLERLLAVADRAGVRVETTVALSPSLELQVMHGIIDAALVNLPLRGDPAGLVMRPIAPSRICLLVPESHPLANRSSVEPSALEGVPLVMCPEVPANAFARQCQKLFVAAGITPKIVQRTTSTAIVELLVERGCGAGIVSEHSTRPNASGLRSVPFESPESFYRHAALYRSDRASEKLLDLLDSLDGDPASIRRPPAPDAPGATRTPAGDSETLSEQL